jgi:two-component system, cell cycle sensor histidine kinase and response regulator CckA
MAVWQQTVSREEMAATLFEESGDALFMFDPESEAIVDVNPAAERLSGFPYRELISNEITYLFRSPAQGALNRLRSAFKHTGAFHSNEDFLLRHRRGGVWLPVNVTVNRLHTRSRTLGLITARDVSERRRLEEHVHRLAAMVESCNDAAIGQSLDDTIESWNAAAERLYGYQANEIIGKPAYVLAGPEEEARWRSLLDQLRHGEQVGPFESMCRHKSGRFIPVSVSMSVIREAQGRIKGTAAFHRDIRERLQLEEGLRQSQKMEAIGQLAGGVAHDFNNLLTVINGYSEMLLSRADVGERARPLVEEVFKAGQRSASLTAQLLAYSRRQVLEPKILNLNERISGVEKMLRRVIGEDVTLESVLAPDLDPVKADPSQIDQVILNLAVNARDAMPRGGKLTITTANVMLSDGHALVHARVPAGRYAQLAIADTGSGMTPDVQARLFEPFFTTKEQGKGTGLGLAVVHGIIAQSGGHITVESELSRGTTFKIYLPRAQTMRDTRNSHPRMEKPARGTETILLVEDEDGVRRLARQWLESAGYHVLEAVQGVEGIRCAEQHQGPIHLLISDVVMPEMGGRQLADRLAVVRPDTKVLFVSGYTDDTVMRQGLQTANLNFIQKPFTMEALSRKVRQVLSQ